MTGHDWRSQLGVYALGMLPPAEEPALRAHLEQCAECRADLDEIAPVAQLLASERDGDQAPGDEPALPPPGDLETRIVTRVAAARGQERSQLIRRRLTAFMGIAAALAATVVITASVVRPPPLPLEPVTLITMPEGVTATANLVGHPWGVELKLVAEGLEDGRVYDVVFIAADGRELDGGGFVGVSDRPVRCNLNVPLLRTDTVAFRVTGEDGEPVFSADLA